MSMTLQRDPVAAAGVAVNEIFFVLERSNGHWSPGAKIIHTFANEQIAEACAAQHKKQYPQRNFGVAVLRSEAREVANPIQIVRASE